MISAHCNEKDEAAEPDFIGKSQRTDETEASAQSELCCCEYINRNRERYHILGCCCHCEDFDLTVTRLVTCQGNNLQTRRNMLLTFQDRLRIPWRGGAKEVSMDTLLPFFAIPIIIGISAINAYAASVLTLATSGFLGYIYCFCSRTMSRSRFLFMWLFWSIVYILGIFEFTVPLLELLPEENLLLVVLSLAALFCLWRTKQRAPFSHVIQSTVEKDELPDIVEEEGAAQTTLMLDCDLDDGDGDGHQPDICAICRKYVPPRTMHCSVCGACIKRSDHHSFWLDCCVGESNHRYYFAGLLFAEAALVLGTNLSLTAICHPFLVIRLLNVYIMLPDDCSEVFQDYELGLSFVISVYALIIAACIFVVLVRQAYLITRGITLQECQRGQYGNRKTWWTNWKIFFNN